MDGTEPIDDDEELWRRIHVKQFVNGRPSSAAFKDSRMSVDRAIVAQHFGRTIRDLAAEGAGVAVITARSVRELGQRCNPDPLDSNPAHALIEGRKPRSVARKIREQAHFIPKSEMTA